MFFNYNHIIKITIIKLELTNLPKKNSKKKLISFSKMFLYIERYIVFVEKNI